MQITLDIPASRIADLFTSAVEGGDPVTTASKGGWCWGMYWHSRSATPPSGGKEPWYAQPAFYEAQDFQIEIIAVENENAFEWFEENGEPAHHGPRDFDTTTAKNLASGALKSHTIKQADIARGFAVMAEKFPKRFGEVLADNTDATTADIFLQSILFGEEKYA